MSNVNDKPIVEWEPLETLTKPITIMPQHITIVPGVDIATRVDLSGYEGIYVRRKGAPTQEAKTESKTQMLVDSPEESLTVVSDTKEEPKATTEKKPAKRGPGRPRTKNK